MYLKSIEVHGFKSFAHKLVFEFKNGITAIVGPNGSGKSNVSDAVRWVLGEQSAKQLRGSKMEDVIFSGTQTRKAQGFAYVAITLDNQDHKLATSYEEVTVARRVYRSGESEYLINGSSCRLRDVQELFLDTGIGKEGYSIIGQGQIDQILSGRPEERRELFDEAAGIVKFKKRKAAAEKNLEAEGTNLCRIDDILKELENQITPLLKQSETAREYLALREKLKTADVNMFLLEYDRIKKELKEAQEKESIAGGDLKEAKELYEATKEEYEQLEQIMNEKNKQLEDKKTLRNESQIKKEKLEGEIKVLHEQILAIRQSSSHYKERGFSVEKQLAEKKEQLSSYQEQKGLLEEELSAIFTQREKEERQLLDLEQQIKSFRKSIETSNSEIMEAMNQTSQIKTSLQRYETMLEQSNINRVELNQRLLKNKSNEVIFDEILETEKENLSKISENINSLLFDNEKLKKLEAEAQALLHSMKQDKERAQKELIGYQSRLDSFKNMTERYDGYGQSIRRVMEQREAVPGIHGVVADIIKVEKMYETAIETALGGSIQNIVTDNEHTAKNLIEFLKRNKYGRATFLPLTAVKGQGGFKNPEALSEEGVIGAAAGLVSCEEKYSGLMEYLLGRVLVADNMDHAISISRKYRQSLRIVTLEGDLINPGGSMSGGAYKNTSNLLGRRREMEDMELEIIKLTNRLKEIASCIDKKETEKQAFKKSEAENKETLQSLYLSQNTAKVKYDQAVFSKKENQKAYVEISGENEALELKMKEIKDSIQALNGSLYDNETKGREKEEHLNTLQQQMEKAQSMEASQREKVEALKLSYSAKEQNGHFIFENIQRLLNELEHLQKERKGIEESMKLGDLKILEKEQEIKEVSLAIEKSQSLIASSQEEINQANSKLEEINQSHKDFFSRREEAALHINELEKEVLRLENQREKLSEQSEGQMNYMWEEYELTFNQALSLKSQSPGSYSQLKKEAGELKNKIKGLGDVNVNAIEDYKNLWERYDLLKTQRDDLIQSEEVLKKIISELDEEMRKQFAAKFEEIKEQFDQVFKELFGGGKGSIILTEGEDILEAGIRIIAQPPGKKLQNMMQLSGGEKALTAISLLFAIQNLKPSPFCLLDEIEAALDDSNVSRFAGYLHKLTKNTQFIVITHRRGTMAAADILYGITMQEKGVSTLVSVNLLEDDLDK